MEHAILTLAGLDEVYIVGASLLLVSKLAFFPSLAGSSAHLNFSTITPGLPPLAEGIMMAVPSTRRNHNISPYSNSCG